MLEGKIRVLLEQLQQGTCSVDEAVSQLKGLPFADLGFAKVDHHREIRLGFPEVVFGSCKTAEQLAEIIVELAKGGGNILCTRIDADKASQVKDLIPKVKYYAQARALVLQQSPIEIKGRGNILVVTAGTGDLPVAEEAYITAELMGNQVVRLIDVGVAGIHRILCHREQLASAKVIIVVAGMEGALPSVIGGMVGRPIIAVPTSIGYGASFNGLAALLGMLNSCAAGVTVVNIDNGFGAAYAASLINRRDE